MVDTEGDFRQVRSNPANSPRDLPSSFASKESKGAFERIPSLFDADSEEGELDQWSIAGWESCSGVTSSATSLKERTKKVCYFPLFALQNRQRMNCRKATCLVQKYSQWMYAKDEKTNIFKAIFNEGMFCMILILLTDCYMYICCIFCAHTYSNVRIFYWWPWFFRYYWFACTKNTEVNKTHEKSSFNLLDVIRCSVNFYTRMWSSLFQRAMRTCWGSCCLGCSPVLNWRESHWMSNTVLYVLCTSGVCVGACVCVGVTFRLISSFFLYPLSICFIPVTDITWGAS